MRKFAAESSKRTTIVTKKYLDTMKRMCLLAIAIICCIIIQAQRVTIPVSRQQLEQSPEGPFEATWKSLEQNYRTPEWFMDAKFGIFIHWGVYSVPAAGSEWYPKHMYNTMSRDHQQRWGKQNQFGYKDFIPMFKAEAVRGEGMKFGVSNHRIENWDLPLTPQLDLKLK